jgi:ubiquinone/menaquinone biosynthesis C-methylase UbiE
MDQKGLWERLANENPFYYINSDFGKKITEKEFWESGEKDYKRYVSDDILIRKLFPNFSEVVILDVGCGIGRLTKFMAKDFCLVLGVDISSKMIELANENLQDYSNVELFETNGNTYPLEDKSVDFVFSYLVFQHIKEERMLFSNFREAYRVLKEGGILKVRVRIDKQSSLDSWWSGIATDESFAVNLGFKLLKKEEVKDYGLWLWLQK